MAGIINGALNGGTYANNTKAQTDWKNNPYWDSSKTGDVMNYGNGTITRGAGGTANYKAAGDTGAGFTFNRDQSVDSVANGSADIANVWESQYGAPAAAKGSANALMSSYAPATTGAATSGTFWNVDPNNMTVQGQLKSILDPSNALMQQAKTTGLQAASERGLINSSMAQTGAHDSMLRAAIPIATSDATMYGKAASDNAGNATSIHNTNTNASVSLSNAATQAASQKYGVDANTANLHWSTAANQANTQTNMATSQGFDLSKMDKASEMTLRQISAEQQNAVEKMAISQGYDLNKMTSQQINDLARMAEDQDYKVANMASANTNEMGRLTSQQIADKELTAIKIAATTDLGLKDTEARQFIQGSASATSLMNNYTHQLASVLKDPSYTTPEARDAARDQLLNSTKAAIQMVGALSGNQDIAAYMDALFPE